jgi:hypothetical protein
MKNRIIVIHPVLTEEERENRMQRIKEATVVFLMEAEDEKREKHN